MTPIPVRYASQRATNSPLAKQKRAGDPSAELKIYDTLPPLIVLAQVQQDGAPVSCRAAVEK